MAVLAWPRNVHFLVSLFYISSLLFPVKSLEQFYGTCGQTYDLMQTNTQSALLKVPMPDDMKLYQDPTRDIKCDIIVTFTAGMNLLIDLYFLDIRPQSNDWKACPTGLEIFDQTGRKYFGSRLCMEAWQWEEKHQQSQYKPLVVESSPLTFRLVSDGPYKGEGFRIHMNQFRPYWPCYPREFRCEQIQRCVHDDLSCDGWDDCGDNSDERVNAGCHLLTTSEICGIIIGIVLLIGSGVITIWFVITYSQLSRQFGLKISESKMPIALNESKVSIDPSLSFARRYNSKESLSKVSRSTVPSAFPAKYYSNNSLDKTDIEKAERMSNKVIDNMSERSYRSNPKKTYNNMGPNDNEPEPVKKTGQYSTRRGRSNSQNSLNREKGNENNVKSEAGEKNEKDRKSQDRYDSDDEKRQRRRSRDRYYSDDDSDYDRDYNRRRRRRSYDRYSDDDSDYERESRRRSRDRYRDRYDDRDDSDTDRPYRRRDSRERDLDRKRDSRERDIDRYQDDRSDRDDDRRRGSRERDRYRDDDRGRRSPSDRDGKGRRSPDDFNEDGRRRRQSRRSRSGDWKRDSYDDDDRRRSRGRSPDRRHRDSPPPYPGQKLSGSKENLGSKEDAPLPPPPSGEDIRRMELAKQLADHAKSAGHPSKAKNEPAPTPKEEPPKIPELPKYEPQKSVTDVQKREQPRFEADQSIISNAQPRQAAEPAKHQHSRHTEEPPKQQYQSQRLPEEPPKQQYQPPRQPNEPPKQQAAVEPPKARWEPPKKKEPIETQRAEPVDENTRKRNSSERRERYSKNRWTPRGNNSHQDSPPPEYEDVTLPPTTNIKINYKEESV